MPCWGRFIWISAEISSKIVGFQLELFAIVKQINVKQCYPSLSSVYLVRDMHGRARKRHKRDVVFFFRRSLLMCSTWNIFIWENSFSLKWRFQAVTIALMTHFRSVKWISYPLFIHNFNNCETQWRRWSAFRCNNALISRKFHNQSMRSGKNNILFISAFSTENQNKKQMTR